MRSVLVLASLLLFSVSVIVAEPVVHLRLDGPIHPITTEIVHNAVEQANNVHATALVIELNSPGGLLDATRAIVTELLKSSVPVITFVFPSGSRAASAAFFILESGDIAAMAPGTNTGAASPVLLGQQMDPVMRSKVENDTSALLRSVVSRRGRNAELAEKTVREAKAFTEQEALTGHLIDLEASNVADLLRQVDGREVALWNGGRVTLHTASAALVETQLTWRQRIMAALADPNIGFIILVLGALGLYMELSSPSLIFPGVLGAILALLGLASLSVFPISAVGASLLVLSLTLFIIEAKVASHGVLAVGGIVAMVLGALLLVNGPPEMRIHLSTALAVALPFGLITFFLVTIALRARRGKVLTGLATMVNEIGVTRTPLEPEGKVLVRGEYWNAVSDVPLKVGTRVRVTAVNGLLLRVESA